MVTRIRRQLRSRVHRRAQRQVGDGRGLFRLALALCMAGVLSGCSAEPPATLADGGEVRFSQLEGQWLIINYWAEWCVPCRKEIPELNELQADRREHGLRVFGVNYDAIEGKKLTRLIELMDIRFPVLTQDPRARWGYDQPSVLPLTVVIGPDGRLREQLVGPQTVETLLAAMH